MQATSFIAGILFFTLSTIARWISQKDLLTSGQKVRLFSISLKGIQGDVLAAVGQAMGILWIVVGIILTQNQESFSSSIAGAIIEHLLVFAPFLIGGAIIRILLSQNKDKGA